MNTLSATYRVVTPMFMSGADHEKAELRLPSIKGVLRFWWRALAWGRLNGDLAAVRREEADLFGSADQSVGQAKVLMRLQTEEMGKPEQQANDWSVNQWQSYTGYGLLDKKERPVRDYISRGTLTVDYLCKSSLSNQARESFTTTLQLFGLLGNVGGRIHLPTVQDKNSKEIDAPLRAIRGRADKNPRIGSLPNRFKASVPEGFEPEACADTVQQAWEKIATQVYESYVKPVASFGHGTEAIWRRQVENFWDIARVIGDGDGHDWLTMRKNWRTYAPPVEGGDWQEISGFVRSIEREKQNTFWQKLKGTGLGTRNAQGFGLIDVVS